MARHRPNMRASRLNVFEDGHRVRGQVWPWQAYMAWLALVAAERPRPAETLRGRILDMIDRHAEVGLYECYGFFEGEPCFGPQGRTGPGRYAPPVIQHAVTAAAVLRLVYRKRSSVVTLDRAKSEQ